MLSEDKDNYGTPFSYATKEEDNELTITDYSGFVISVAGEKVVTDVTANDGLWHFICVVWEGTGGRWAVSALPHLRSASLVTNIQQVCSNKNAPSRCSCLWMLWIAD